MGVCCACRYVNVLCLVRTCTIQYWYFCVSQDCLSHTRTQSVTCCNHMSHSIHPLNNSQLYWPALPPPKPLCSEDRRLLRCLSRLFFELQTRVDTVLVKRFVRGLRRRMWDQVTLYARVSHWQITHLIYRPLTRLQRVIYRTLLFCLFGP